MDVKLTRILSNRGKELLVINNFKFCEDSRKKDSVRWRCVNKKTKCKAKVCTTPINYEIISSNLIHNHKEDLTIRRQALSNSVKRKAICDISEEPAKLIQLELQKDTSARDQLTLNDIHRVRVNLWKSRRLALTKLPQLQEEVGKSKQIKGHQRVPSDSRDFREATKRDAQLQLQQELDKLLATAPPLQKEAVKRDYDGFVALFERFLQEEGPSVLWDKIEKLPNDAVRNYTTLESPTTELIHNMLSKLVVVKLNGGLGTSMGCHGPKSVITVRNNLTFLDLTVQQIEYLNKTYKTNVPLVLMNSFNTDEDTQKIVRKYKGLQVEIHTFNQSCYPRINRESLLPVAKSSDVDNSNEAFYPPGHGDFYASFKNCGLLSKFIEQGRQYCFISNIDNLGATVDMKILNLLLNPNNSQSHEFVMEVTDKTRADVKGGTLIQYENKLRLLEIAQVPKEHVDDFKSVKTFKFFNTNNLWAKLDAIDRVLNENLLNLEIIVNNKSLDNGLNIIQLETAVGAAMKTFEGGIGINVPRSRFLPVKKTSDLLLVMSNLYSLRNGTLVMSPQRMFPTTPLVKLGDNHFSKVKEFLGRFANIPDIIELDHLTVSGDVTFGRGVALKGTVIIIANHGDRIDIPTGAILENKIVSGNMRILDH